MGEKIIFYSTHCPRCKVLETKLKQKNISYEECDDKSIMTEKGFTEAPKLQVDELVMDFKTAVNWIGER